MTETELINQSLKGNDLAFAQLISRYQGFVYSVAYRFTRNGIDSEDLTQECFIRLWKNLDKYDTELNFKSWLAKIITNLCLDFLRSAKRKHNLNTVDIEQQDNLKSYADAEQEINTTELNELIMSLSEKLTPKQKAVFILRDLEKLEVEEVCVILNETADHIKSNLYHARKFLREQLRHHYNYLML